MQDVEFLTLCYLQNLKIKMLLETNFVPHSFHFSFYGYLTAICKFFNFFLLQAQQHVEQEYNTQAVALQRRLFSLFHMGSWDNSTDQEVLSWFSMPQYKENIMHSYSAESGLSIFCPQSPCFEAYGGGEISRSFSLTAGWDCASCFFCFYRSKLWGGRAVGSNHASLSAMGEKSTEMWEGMRHAAMYWTNVYYHEGSYRVVFQSFPLWKSGIFPVDALSSIS